MDAIPGWLIKWQVVLYMILLAGCQSLPAGQSSVNPERLRLSAQAAYQQGDLVSAESMLLRNVQQHSGDADSWFLLGNIYVRTAQYKAAERAYYKAAQLKPEQQVIWHNLALVYLRQSSQALLEGKLHSDADFEPLLGWLLQVQGVNYEHLKPSEQAY